MTDHAATPTRHWIIVTWDDQWQGEPDERADIELVHEGCTLIKAEPSDVIEGEPYDFYDCDVERLFGDMGTDALDVSPAQLSPGRYEIRPWFHTYPAVPGLHGEEYDAGIEVIGADGHPLLPM